APLERPSAKHTTTRPPPPSPCSRHERRSHRSPRPFERKRSYSLPLSVRSGSPWCYGFGTSRTRPRLSIRETPERSRLLVRQDERAGGGEHAAHAVDE